MGIFANFLTNFPGYYMKREAARAHYEVNTATRQNKKKREKRGPNSSTRDDVKPLREQIRHLEQNSDIVKGAFDILVANIVGLGVNPEPMILKANGDPYDEANQIIDDAHKLWRRHPEVTGEHDEGSAQRLTVRSWLRDGEMFQQHIIGTRRDLDHGTAIPYSYEMIESDQLAPNPRQGMRNGIMDGIEVNAWNKPTMFHFYKHHPGEYGTRLVATAAETKRISAKRITHLKLVQRIGQLRGISIAASVIRRLADIGEIDESERVAARVAAALTAVIIKGEPFGYTAPDADAEDDYRDIEFGPGTIIDDLMPGEDVKMLASNRPNNAMIPFRDSQLRSAASGFNVSFSSLSKNYNGTYSAQRQEMVEQRMIYSTLWSLFVERSERRKYENFMNAGIASGVIALPDDMDPESMFSATFTQPAMPWIDLLKEAKGYESILASGLDAKANIIRARGGNPREINRLRKQDSEQSEKENGESAVVQSDQSSRESSE